MSDGVTQFLEIVPRLLLAVFFAVLLVQKFLDRNMPRVGGKIGGKIGGRAAPPGLPVPEGFSRVNCREITVFGAPRDAWRYPNLKTYLREGAVARTGLVHIYCVAACNTRIEIPAEPADYERIDAAGALALLRELPDPRLVRRLHLSDVPSFLDPWVRKVTGQNVFLLGNATSTGIIVLYVPDRRFGHTIGLTLLHEWLHLVAFKSAWHVRRFRWANAIEPLAPLAIEPVSFGDPKTATYEAWSELGEKLFGYDEAIARQAARDAPVHAMILWRRIERIMRKAPKPLRSTRLAEFEARAAFMHREIAPKAHAARKRLRLWSRLWRSR